LLPYQGLCGKNWRETQLCPTTLPSGRCLYIFKSRMVEKKNQRTVVVAMVPTEPEGALIVGLLKNVGIRAQLVGGLASAFRANAPGEVKVIVLEEDAQKAFEFLRQKR
jgi:hypothetical protein